jgi:hypothetical protein
MVAIHDLLAHKKGLQRSKIVVRLARVQLVAIPPG